MAEHGALTAGKDRGHPPSPWREAWIPDGIHAPEYPVQALAIKTVLDRSPSEADLLELASRHDTVLAVGELRNRGVRPTSGFYRYAMANLEHGGIEASSP